jgi:hypothetical protein
MADKKKSPYDFSNDPAGDARMAGHPLQRANPGVKAEPSLKRKQKQSIVDEATKDDPVGNAVRDLWKKVRGK